MIEQDGLLHVSTSSVAERLRDVLSSSMTKFFQSIFFEEKKLREVLLRMLLKVRISFNKKSCLEKKAGRNMYDLYKFSPHIF